MNRLTNLAVFVMIGIMLSSCGVPKTTNGSMAATSTLSQAEIDKIKADAYASAKADLEAKAQADAKAKPAVSAPITSTKAIDPPTAVTPAPTVIPTPAQTAPKDRVDFKSAEHIAASKDRLAKDYPDSFATQKMLQSAAVKDQSNLEDLVNSLTDAEWSALKGSYTRLVGDYSDSPSTVFMLFKNEVESFRSMK